MRMRAVRGIVLAALLVLGLGSALRPAAAAAQVATTPSRVAADRVGPATLLRGLDLLADYYMEPLDPAALARAGSAGMLAALRAQGIAAEDEALDAGADRASAEQALQQRYEDLLAAYPDVDALALAHAALSGMVQAVADPHTTYLDPRVVQAMRAFDASGQRPGTGAIVAGPHWTVLDVYAGSPAAAAGLRVGDRLETINGRPLPALPDSAVREVSCKLGDRGLVRLRRVGSGAEEDVDLACAALDVPFVEARAIGDVGYVRVRSFKRSTVADEMEQAIRGLQGQGVRGIVLDLRNNSGGLMEQWLRVLRLMAADGPVYRMVDRSGQEVTRTLCQITPRAGLRDGQVAFVDSPTDPGCTDEPILSVPLAVLVDERSASAAELLAVNLQERGIGRLFGTRTLGASAMAMFFSLPDDSALEMSLFRVDSPGGRRLNGVGVEPDETVALRLDELEAGLDAPLQHAIAYLRQGSPRPNSTQRPPQP